MRRFVYQLVERLSHPDANLSRNRQPALFASPAGARALHLFRHLRALEDDLVRHGDRAKLSAQTRGALTELRLEIASLRLVRTALLTADDLEFIARRGGALAEALASLTA